MVRLQTLYPDNLDEIMLEYLNRFLGSFRPDLVSERNYLQLIEERRNGDRYFAVFALRTMVLNEPEKPEETDRYPAMIVLEMYPEIRVVKMTTVPDEMPNPGNG